MPDPIRSRPATIKDVAERCGLSKSTVAYVVNQDPRYRSTEATRRKVMQAVADLGYSPNFTARGLSSKRSRLIGVLMPISGSRFYDTMMLELQRSLWRRDYGSFFSFWGSAEAVSEHAVRALLQRNVDGMICWPGAEAFVPAHVPTVMFHHHGTRDSVSHDFAAATAAAMDHLAALGHVRIGFIGESSGPRLQAFTRESRRRGLPLRPGWVRTATEMDAAGPAFHALMAQAPRPTAIIAYNDMVSLAIISHAREAGIAIPDRLSLISFDDIRESAYFLPPLTTFNLQLEAMSAQLVELLIRRMEDPEAPASHVVVRPELIVRASTGTVGVGEGD